MKLTFFDIISIPNAQLRTPARLIRRYDKQVQTFIAGLGETLKRADNPKGVGLAAPQVDQNWQVFATYLEEQLEFFLNPEIIKHSDELELGETDDADLEGCLSIPKLYGPVPRWSWVELAYDQLPANEAKERPLTRTSRRFQGFPARVIQHEFDHLAGVLFIDYSLGYELPVYMAENRRSKMAEVPKEIFATLHKSSLFGLTDNKLALHPTKLPQ